MSNIDKNTADKIKGGLIKLVEVEPNKDGIFICFVCRAALPLKLEHGKPPIPMHCTSGTTEHAELLRDEYKI